MDINDKKLQRTSRLINFSITTMLCIFLILLSNTIMGDLEGTISTPKHDDFKDKASISKLEAEAEVVHGKLNALSDTQQNFKSMQELALSNKNDEQESFDNWLKTRGTLGNPAQDTEVISRLRKIDEYQVVAQGWSAKVDSIEELRVALRSEINSTRDNIYSLENKAYYDYQDELVKYDLYVFFIRLLFVGPILALGIFFFLRYRNHKFKPLFMGFTLFSIYAFFIGLVPYLPSFGGYIRYLVGILLTIGLGYYAITHIRIYMEKKQLMLKEASTERAKKLQIEIAEKAFNNHICPSCGKDFFLKNWERKHTVSPSKELQPITNYCRYCGLQLIKECPTCKQDNYAHLPFCISCGENLK